jgi:hypothetical protein
MNRRDLLNVGGMIATSTMLTSYRVSAAQTAAPNPYEPAFALLDRFVEEYLADMNAPGLTLALADASGVQRVCTYGLDDLARHTPLNVDELFHIGFISKSFLAVCLLQLRDEGKLDLQALPAARTIATIPNAPWPATRSPSCTPWVTSASPSSAMIEAAASRTAWRWTTPRVSSASPFSISPPRPPCTRAPTAASPPAISGGFS